MFAFIVILGFCFISVHMIRGFVAFDDRERLTALVCLFCFMATYLIFDLITFDPKMKIDEQVIDDHIKANNSGEFYYISAST
jgi:hypothetical protein